MPASKLLRQYLDPVEVLATLRNIRGMNSSSTSSSKKWEQQNGSIACLPSRKEKRKFSSVHVERTYMGQRRSPTTLRRAMKSSKIMGASWKPFCPKSKRPGATSSVPWICLHFSSRYYQKLGSRFLSLAISSSSVKVFRSRWNYQFLATTLRGERTRH